MLIVFKHSILTGLCSKATTKLEKKKTISSVIVALSSEHQPRTPAYASKQKSKKFLQASIFLRTNSAHNQYQKDVIEICTGNLPKRFVHEGFWEVLDEGIGGSLKTHLQEVLPSCKGEQSLTFKRHQGSTVDAADAQKVHILKIVPSYWQLIYYHRCLKWTERFELEHQWHNLLLDYFTLKQPWRWNTENLKLSQFYTRKV